MMTTTDDEKYRLRKKAIEYLKGPTRRKASGVLDRGHGNRCCLGHICQALKRDLNLEVTRRRLDRGFSVKYDDSSSTLPSRVRDSLGFFDVNGTFKTHLNGFPIPVKFEELGSSESTIALVSSLANLNDNTPASPRQIGEWLEEVILGGPSTPWERIDPSEEVMRDA